MHGCRGMCMVVRGHTWLLGGMCGCCQGACMVAGGASVVAGEGGACVVAGCV